MPRRRLVRSHSSLHPELISGVGFSNSPKPRSRQNNGPIPIKGFYSTYFRGAGHPFLGVDRPLSLGKSA